MNNEWQLQAEIHKWLFDTDIDLLNCVLLIRYLCAVPEEKQPCEALNHQEGEALWRRLAAEAYAAGGQVRPIIEDVMCRIKEDLPFAPGLPAPGDADEEKLKTLVRELDRLPADGETLSFLFECGQNTICRSARTSGDYYTPMQLVRWLAKLLEIDHDGSVYDPCCGSGAMLCGAALACPDKALQLYGQTLDEASFSTCGMNLTLHGFPVDLGPRAADTLAQDLHADCVFDYIITNPPFNLPDWSEGGVNYRDTRWQYGLPPQKNANFAWLQHILSHLRPGGRALTLLPNSTLTTQNRAERKIRAYILDAGWVEAIFALPAGIFRNTRIPCCAWVLGREHPRNKVLFVDARQMDVTEAADGQKLIALLSRYRAGEPLEKTEWYAAASMMELAQNGYLLSPNLYTRQKPLSLPSSEDLRADFNTAADALCALVDDPELCKNIQKWKNTEMPGAWQEWRLPELYAVAGGVVAKKEAFGQGVPMADVKTVVQHMFLPGNLPAKVRLPDSERRKYELRAGDILLNRTSENLEQLACGCAVLADYGAVYGAYLKRLRPTADNIDPRYAAGYFRSRVYRQEVRRVCLVYTTRVNINLRQLAKIRIYTPAVPWQMVIGETLERVVDFGRTYRAPKTQEAVRRFTETFIEKFITYPAVLYQKERDRE